MANILDRGFAMADFPRSLIEFQRRFPDEEACAAYLAGARWPEGFRCPACGHDKGWELATKAFTRECACCGKQTSVTAGTIMHSSKLPLTAWFWAAYLMATHSNGISALQLRSQLGLGSYGVAPVRQTSPRHGRAGPLAAGRSRRGRRDGNPLAHRG
jgi:Transposase zinc-ribbon domain